jgi:hypothetical protein
MTLSLHRTVQMIYQEIHMFNSHTLDVYSSHFHGKSHPMMCIIRRLERPFLIAGIHNRNKSLVKTVRASDGVLF